MRRDHIHLFLFLNAVALLLSLLVTSVTMAGPAVPSQMMDKGGLFLPGDEAGMVVPAPLLHTEIEASVSGPIVRYRMRHTFINESDEWTEAIYTYPLPTDSAVDSLEMTVGKRKIIGKITEKIEAKRQFVAAKQAGKRASLVQQHRQNLFSTSLTNIAPGEQIIIEIGFSETLRLVDDGFRLRMPLVVGPRYIPGQPIAGYQMSGWHSPTDIVPDADQITPPLRTENEGSGNPVTLSIDIDAGFGVDAIESPSHKINIVRNGDTKAKVSLVETVPADKDFTLIWQAKAGGAPSAGFFNERIEDMHYGLLTLTPPIQKKLDAIAPPREVVFIVDTSGSMEGTSIKQAKLAIEMALERLRPSDTFRIIRFSSNVSAFQMQAVSATPANINSGKQFVSSLLAEGGTEIVAAMGHALSHRRDKNRLTQIILMTDGAVGNEDALFALIHDQIQLSRLFTVGIGSAPNGYLMTRAATAGRGTYIFIENIDEISQQMAKLFEKLERPAMTNISLNWQGHSAPVSYWPNPVPDLYNGEPISVLAAFPVGTTGVTVSGQIDGKLWFTPVTLQGVPQRPGIAALWARQKIKGLEAALFHDDDPKLVKAEILGTALKFGLVSRYTSLLAVDEKKTRPENETLVAHKIATNLPDGWVRSEDMKPVINDPTPLHPMKSFDRADPSLKKTMRSAASELSGLPQTATAGPLALILGLLAFVASLVIWRRREPQS